MSFEQKIRALLFYLCVSIFLIGLPFILSFALSYKFDRRTFKFVKTGLISINTRPPGAVVYFSSRPVNEKTPTTITEILPGDYIVRLEIEKFYPWVSQVRVEAGKVTQLDRIILFPLRPDIAQLNKERISSFWVDAEKSRIYYVDLEGLAIYNSDLQGDNFQELGSIPEMTAPPKKWKVSSDRSLLACFNPHQIAIVSLEQPHRPMPGQLPFVLNFANRKISDVFWHSDNYHLILVTDKSIEALEAMPHATPVILVNLNKRNVYGFYDTAKDTLYFLDSQMAEDRRFYDNVYKLELGAKAHAFTEEMKDAGE